MYERSRLKNRKTNWTITIIITCTILIGCTATTIIMAEKTDWKDTSKNTETLNRVEVKDTPITVIHNLEDNRSFGVMGKYRVTEIYDDPRKVEKELKKVTWNRVIQVIMIMREDEVKENTKTLTKKSK